MTVENVNYEPLSQNTVLLDSFKGAVSTVISDESGLPASAITVDLSAGPSETVKVAATILPPNDVKVDKMSNSSTLGASISTSVEQVPGIETVSSGTIGVSGLVISTAVNAAKEVIAAVAQGKCDKTKAPLDVDPDATCKSRMLWNIVEGGQNEEEAQANLCELEPSLCVSCCPPDRNPSADPISRAASSGGDQLHQDPKDVIPEREQTEALKDKATKDSTSPPAASR